jgi:hypothetical protein
VEEGVVSDEAAEGDARRGGMGEVRRGRGGDAEEHLLEELAVHGIEAWGGPGEHVTPWPTPTGERKGNRGLWARRLWSWAAAAEWSGVALGFVAALMRCGEG